MKIRALERAVQSQTDQVKVEAVVNSSTGFGLFNTVVPLALVTGFSVVLIKYCK